MDDRDLYVISVTETKRKSNDMTDLPSNLVDFWAGVHESGGGAVKV